MRRTMVMVMMMRTMVMMMRTMVMMMRTMARKRTQWAIRVQSDMILPTITNRVRATEC